MQILSRRLLIVVAMLVLGLACQVRAADEDVEWIADNQGCKVANPMPRQGETITWSGACKDGYADGEGILQWYYNGQADDRYEGRLEKGWAEGHGVLNKADGGKYDGGWKHSLQDGMGRFEAPDGSVYDGEWRDGKPNGSGQYRTPEGRMFMGQWKDGVFEGDEEPDEDDDDPNRT